MYNKKSKYERMKSEWMKVRFLTELTPEQEAHFNTFYESEKNVVRTDIFTVSKQIMNIVGSCTTKEHFQGAENMILNLHHVYSDASDESATTKSLYQYLIDHKNLRNIV